MKDERYTQRWEEIERRFPGSSAAFDRDLGDHWLEDRDGPRFDIYGPTLHVFVGESSELGHRGPWASAFYDAAQERWIVKADHRNVTLPGWRLRWWDGDEREGELELDPERSYLVGRISDADIRTDNRTVTRHHARFEWRDGAWTVDDLRSANGTRCNGKPIKRAVLCAGDVVRCGDLKIRIYRF